MLLLAGNLADISSAVEAVGQETGDFFSCARHLDRKPRKQCRIVRASGITNGRCCREPLSCSYVKGKQPNDITSFRNSADSSLAQGDRHGRIESGRSSPDLLDSNSLDVLSRGTAYSAARLRLGFRRRVPLRSSRQNRRSALARTIARLWRNRR